MNSLHHKAGFFSPRKEKIDFNKKSYFLQYHKIIFKHKVYLLNRNKKFNILKMEFKSDWSNVSDCISGTFLKSKIDYNYIYRKNKFDGSFLEIFIRGSNVEKLRRIQFDISPGNIKAMAKTGLPLTLCLIPEHLIPSSLDNDTGEP
jgi:hypothetical protein